MTEAVAASVTQSEEEAFWRTYMPSGVASTAKDASMETGQDGGSTAATETTQAHKEDDRGGKWARDQGHRGKGRNGSRGGDTMMAIPSGRTRSGMAMATGMARRRSSLTSSVRSKPRSGVRSDTRTPYKFFVKKFLSWFSCERESMPLS